MRVGVLEILAHPSRQPYDFAHRLVLDKQYSSITPQAISVWCKQLGHETFYATYYGIGDPLRLLPRDLDIVFLSCYTQVSLLAYALAKLYRRRGALTVIGGSHARAFPADCLRFFDLVVKDCDKNLIADILAGHYDPGSAISSAKPFEDVPTVEERLPEIRASAFFWGRRRNFMTTVPMLASMGCPYQCDFCVDWNNPYRQLPLDRLASDLNFLARKLPGMMMAFHDPNFAVKFDQVLNVLESVAPGGRPPYVMESSLSILRGDRLEKLKVTNCIVVAAGIESWADYSNKAGVSGKTGAEKVRRVVEHLRRLSEYVHYQQGAFIFGLDTDQGEEPVELTKVFMDQTPFVWPAVNIPVPFGGTPLFDQLLAAGRIRKEMPFSFYYSPYLVIQLKNYEPITYYEKMIELFAHSASWTMLKKRLRCAPTWHVKVVHWARTLNRHEDIRHFQRLLQLLRTDPAFRAFHEGRTEALPEFYHAEYERMLGPYAPLLSRADRRPDLTQIPAAVRPAREPDLVRSVEKAPAHQKETIEENSLGAASVAKLAANPATE